MDREGATAEIGAPDGLIGRGGLIDALVALATDERSIRLVITGPTGVGKTAVALEVAARLGNRVVAPVRGVTDAQELMVRLGRALSIVDAGRGIRKAVAATLAATRSTVVLDGLEDASLLEPLGELDGVRILITASEPTGLHGEHVVRLRPLAIPASDVDDPAMVRQAPAVRLFLDRARRADAGYDPTDDDLRVIAEVTRRLDGLPLAIELAAARTAVMAPAALLQVMDRLGPWEVVGLPLVEEIERSYERLDHRDQAAFLALAVFAEGAAIDALHAVAGLPSLADTVDALSMLVDQSLASTDAATARYGLAAAAKDWADCRLEGQHQLATALRARHAAWFCSTASERPIDLDAGVEDELAIDHAESLAAIEWLRAGGETERALELGVAIARDFERRGEPDTGRTLLIDLLAGAPSAPARLRAVGHLWIARFEAERAGSVDVHGALGHLQQARDLAEQAGHEPTVLRAMLAICENHTLLGATGLADAVVAEGLERCRGPEHAAARVGFLVWRAVLAHQEGDAERAAPLVRTAIADAMALGDRRLIVRGALVYWGLPDHVRTDPFDCPSASELLEMAQADGDLRAQGYLLAILTGQAMSTRDPDRASVTCRELLQLSRRTGNAPLGRLALAAVISLAVHDGDHAWAATVAGTLEPRLPAVVASMPPHAAAVMHEAIAAANSALGDGSVELHRVGRSRTLTDVMLDAERRLERRLDRSPAAEGAERRAPSLIDALTPREVDVLEQLAIGRTNKEIAATLGLRPKTVMHHCAAIYRKLGVRGRAGAVAVAMRAGTDRSSGT